MQTLAHQRCFNHAGREAAARCPECGRDYCRECVTEHEGRLTCAACLQKKAQVPQVKRRGFSRVWQVARCAASVVLLWFVFYLIGERLASLPDSFHQGTLWQTHWFDSE